ncbi:MAG: hypothetical protein WBA41_12870 [Rivularia sp. (in: cyanobacteria)]
MELIHVNSALSYTTARNPFNVLFYATAERQDISTIDAKVKFLTALTRTIEQVEINSESSNNLNNWLGMVSGISCTAIIISAGTLNPIPAIATTLFGVSSAFATIGGTILKHTKEAPVLDNLKRYRCCLESSSMARWATLWHLIGNERFLDSLVEGTKGTFFDGQLVRPLPSLNAVIDYVASCGGVTPQQLIGELKAVANGRKPTLKLLNDTEVKPVDFHQTPELPATTLNTDFESLHGNAIAIRDALVNGADESKLPGCVILASPGAGKTTLLGSAWMQLRNEYEEDFKSLAIIVKQEDLPSFKTISDSAICVKTSPKRAAIEIIKFVNSSMCSDGSVSRLFLDDYLTSQKYLAAGVKGAYIDLETYAIFDSKKEANEANSVDAISLKDALDTALNEAWLVGREYNLSLWVSSHSSNVDDLPFMGSSDARSVGDFVLLAKDNKRDFINNALMNNYLIPDSNKRSQLKQQLDNVIVNSDEPLILANYNNWTLGVVPQSVRNEYEQMRSKTVIQPATKTKLQTEQPTVLQYEDAGTCEDAEELNIDLQAAQLKITVEAFKVLDKLKEFNEPVPLREIQRKRPFGRKNSTSKKLSYYLKELIIAELVIVNKDDSKELYKAVTLSHE